MLRTLGLFVIPLVLAVAIIGVGVFVVCDSLERGMNSMGRHAIIKSSLKNMDSAVELYRLNHKSSPASLEVLLDPDPVNGGVPYLKEARSIIDPWGEIYQYDPAGPRNRGEKPDIWTDTPHHGMIGNWSDLPR